LMSISNPTREKKVGCASKSEAGREKISLRIFREKRKKGEYVNAPISEKKGRGGETDGKHSRLSKKREKLSGGTDFDRQKHEYCDRSDG